MIPIKENNNLQFRKNNRRLALYTLTVTFIVYMLSFIMSPTGQLISPLANTFAKLEPIQTQKSTKEVFGFAPYWTFNKLDNVDFNVLTTFAYFGLEVHPDGNLETDGPGYTTFKSRKATEVFQKAHDHGTRVVLTITQMNNANIKALLDSNEAQERAIEQSVRMVKERGIDGINVDFEYTGNPGEGYKDKFSVFVDRITKRMHSEVPGSKVTVSVYASAAKDPKMYDIASIGTSSDGIFMMAYDYAVAGSDHAIPTAPLYGYKEGKYWYDVSTAVEDFLKVMEPEKLILGVPWYGYNYPVQNVGVKAPKHQGYYTYYWYRYRQYSQYHSFPSHAQTYALAEDIQSTTPGIKDYQTGWDDDGKVGWKAYYDLNQGVWRMIFIEDTKSLGIKFDYAKQKNLGGVGMWALGFDDGKRDFWTLLEKKFGRKLADMRAAQNANRGI